MLTTRNGPQSPTQAAPNSLKIAPATHPANLSTTTKAAIPTVTKMTDKEPDPGFTFPALRVAQIWVPSLKEVALPAPTLALGPDWRHWAGTRRHGIHLKVSLQALTGGFKIVVVQMGVTRVKGVDLGIRTETQVVCLQLGVLQVREGRLGTGHEEGEMLKGRGEERRGAR